MKSDKKIIFKKTSKKITQLMKIALDLYWYFPYIQQLNKGKNNDFIGFSRDFFRHGQW